MIVVAVKPVRDGRLRRDRFNCRMTIDAGHRRVKPGIRDAVDADAAIVIRNILDQPIDRVVSVAGFVNLVSLFVGDVWPHIFVFAFAHIAPAHVLIDEDIAFARKQIIGPKRIAKSVQAVRRDAVTRAVKHERILLLRVLRLVDRSEELHTVAHRNHHFALAVMAFDVIGQLALLRRHLPRALRKRSEGRQDQQENCGCKIKEAICFHGVSERI
jgi:hypothetical protein